jgi:hypothetical protein
MLENSVLGRTCESKRLEGIDDTEKCIMSLTIYHYGYKIKMKWPRHAAPMGVI